MIRNAQRTILAIGLALFAVANLAMAADFKAEDLVGSWEFVKTDAEKGPPKGAKMTVTFEKGDKCTLNMSLGDKSLKANGTYKLDKDKLTMSMKTPDGKEKSETSTIKELTKEKFVVVDEKDGKKETTEFKKAK